MPPPLPSGPEVVQFGDYVANLRTGELLRNGTRLLLPEQPFRILALLVRQRGEPYVKAGRRADAEKLAVANRAYPFREAIIHAALGNRDRSFDSLERMAVSEPQRLGLTLRFPELAALRDDPRFDALRRKLRLP